MCWKTASSGSEDAGRAAGFRSQRSVSPRPPGPPHPLRAQLRAEERLNHQQELRWSTLTYRDAEERLGGPGLLRRLPALGDLGHLSQPTPQTCVEGLEAGRECSLDPGLA